MDDLLSFYCKKVIPVVSFILAVCLIAPIVMSAFSHSKSYKETKSGYIVEKRYVPSSSYLFGYTDSHYRIYIPMYYEGLFGLQETEKYFIVEKEVFDQYKVGDFFDSTKI